MISDQLTHGKIIANFDIYFYNQTTTLSKVFCHQQYEPLISEDTNIHHEEDRFQTTQWSQRYVRLTCRRVYSLGILKACPYSDIAPFLFVKAGVSPRRDLQDSFTRVFGGMEKH